MAQCEKLKATLQNSYYGKAKVYRDNNGETLVSYDTPVARIDNDGTFTRIWNGWSATTAKHVNDFRIQHGLPTIGKKAWDAMPARTPELTYNVYVSTGFATHKCPARLTETEAEAEAERLQRARPHCIVWYE